MKIYFFLLVQIVFLSACSKTDIVFQQSTTDPVPVQPTTGIPEFTRYEILKGNHYCNTSAIKAVSLVQQVFKVKFDSTAIYTTSTLDNQFDINKLFGFSEGLDPHTNSARIGWSYNSGSLRLYAYVYNRTILSSMEISTVGIGDVIHCSIRADKKNYIFYVNDKSVVLERGTDTDLANGYQLYPYFGGDETAPHNINIFISESTGK